MANPRIQDILTSNPFDSTTSLLSLASNSTTPKSRGMGSTIGSNAGAPKSPRPFQHSRNPALHELLAKRRLVEQFYTHKGEGQRSVPQSYTDLVSVFRQGHANVSPTKDGDDPGLVTENFGDIVKNGRMEYAPLDREISCPPSLADAMLNIDLKRYADVDNVILVLDSTASALQRCSFEKVELPQKELTKLSKHLGGLSGAVQTLQSELLDTVVKLRLQYRGDVQLSVSKLEKLEQTLDTLTYRLNESKKIMAANKDIMATDMADKIEVLDYVLKKFDEYDQLNRHNRVRQITAGFSVAVLLVCVYIAVSHFGTF